MKYFVVEWVDGKKGYLFMGPDSRLKVTTNHIIINGGDGSYRQRDKTYGITKENVRQYWTQENQPEDVERIQNGEEF